MKRDSVSFVYKYTYVNHSALRTIRQMPMFYYRDSNPYYEEIYNEYNLSYKMKKYIYLKEIEIEGKLL